MDTPTRQETTMDTDTLTALIAFHTPGPSPELPRIPVTPEPTPAQVRAADQARFDTVGLPRLGHVA